MSLNKADLPVADFSGGYDISVPATRLDPSKTPNCSNVRWKNGAVEKRPGFVYHSVAPLSMTIILGGVHAQTYTTAAKRFTIIGLNGTLVESAYLSAAATWTKYDSGTDKLPVVYTGGDHWLNTCSIVDDTTSPPDGVADLDRTIFNVTPTDPLLLYNTGGAATDNYIGYGDGADVGTVAGNLQAKVIISFFGRLVLFGTPKSNVIKWSVQWNHDDLSASGSGNFYLFDTGGPVMNAALLNDTIICYKDDSIWVGTRLTASPFIRWSCKYPDVGLMSPRLLAQFGNYHLFVGNNNIYAYAGGSELYDIGTPVWKSFLADIRKGEAAAGQVYKNRCFASVHRDTGDICFWVVTGTALWPNKAYVYNWFDKTWTIWNLPVSGANQLVFTGWAEYDTDSLQSSLEHIPFYFCLKQSDATTVGNPMVLKYDDVTYTDVSPITSTTDGVLINAYIETKTFIGSLDEATNWARVVADAKGLAASSPLSVQVSTNDGYSYDTARTQTLSANNYDSYLYAVNLSSKAVRYKFSDATISKAFALRGYQIVPSEDERKAQ